jgi:hypothetical protein
MILGSDRKMPLGNLTISSPPALGSFLFFFFFFLLATALVLDEDDLNIISVISSITLSGSLMATTEKIVKSLFIKKQINNIIIITI